MRKPYPILGIFSFLSKRWMLLILNALCNNITTFNAIKNELHGISSRTLSERLKELEEFHFVERKIISEKPIKIQYQVTEKARAFEPVLQHIAEWAKEWKE